MKQKGEFVELSGCRFAVDSVHDRRHRSLFKSCRYNTCEPSTFFGTHQGRERLANDWLICRLRIHVVNAHHPMECDNNNRNLSLDLVSMF